MGSKPGPAGAVKASVIIPTYNRRDNLVRVLGSLSSQSARQGDFEVIVVDDGSTDETPRLAEQSYPFPLRYLRQANQGSAAARNAGAEQSTGELLIFLDDDMVAEPNYVKGLLLEHHDYPGCIGMGSLRPFIPEKRSIFIQVYPVDEEYLKQRVFPVGEGTPDDPGEDVSFLECVTNNLSVGRDDFFWIGSMQDVAGDGPTWWGDIDFGYRAQLKGFRFRRSGRAFCTHCDRSVSDLETAAARQYKSAVLAAALFRKFPALQHQLPMFQDMLPVNWRNDSPRLLARKLARKAASTWVSIRFLASAARFLERRYPSPALLRPLYRWILGGYLYQGYREGLRKYGLDSRFRPVTQTS